MEKCDEKVGRKERKRTGTDTLLFFCVCLVMRCFYLFAGVGKKRVSRMGWMGWTDGIAIVRFKRKEKQNKG